MAGRDDALAQLVRIKDSSIETPGGLENISNSSGELAGEPSPYRNWERPLVLAFANLPRKQWTDDLFQESFRLTASHLEGRVDPAAGDEAMEMRGAARTRKRGLCERSKLT